MRRLVIDTNIYIDWINHIDGSDSIVGDVLIALSARSIGAIVITQNERDFRAIQAVRAFELVVVPTSH